MHGNTLRWENPPRRNPFTGMGRKPQRDWTGACNLLVANPERWALLSENERSPQLSYMFKKGMLKPVENAIREHRGKFEAEAHRGDQGYRIYVRWVPWRVG